MATFSLSITCNNSDFDGDAVKITHILNELSHKIEALGFADHELTLRDINGNTVGSYRYQSPKR
jgi:hypothetical protein